MTTANYKFTRSSPEGLSCISNLSTTANILLFTPVLIPASEATSARSKDDTIDPFESFGRALSLYHKRIRHVPYQLNTGYTETHAAFLSQADAVIAVVCEPDMDKDRKISRQMEFAKSTLDALRDKEANASSTLVLVQCSTQGQRALATAAFVNVIEVDAYDDEVAKDLAKAIFKFKR